MMWFLVAWVIALDGGHMGTGSSTPMTIETCQQQLKDEAARLPAWASQWKKQEANAGWVKCVQANNIEEAMDKVHP